jgi:hypothetical protein
MAHSKPPADNWIRNCAFRYQCEQKWEQLEQTDSSLVRYCKVCDQNVHMVLHEKALTEAIRLNRCVYILHIRADGLTEATMGLPRKSGNADLKNNTNEN